MQQVTDGQSQRMKQDSSMFLTGEIPTVTALRVICEIAGECGEPIACCWSNFASKPVTKCRAPEYRNSRKTGLYCTPVWTKIYV